MQNFLLVIQTLGVGVTEWEKAGIIDRELAVLRHIKQFGWEVSVVSTSQKDFSDQRRIIKTYSEFNFIFLGSNPLFSALRCMFLGRHSLFTNKSLGRIDYLVIRTNQLYCSHLGLILKYKFKSKLVIRQGFNLIYDVIRDPEVSILYRCFFRAYEKFFLPKADLCEFTTELSYEQSQGRIRKNLNFVVIPNFVDEANFPIRIKPKSKLSSPVFGFYGRFQAQKNLDNLIKAANNFPWVRFQLIGDGPDKSKLEKLVAELELNNIEFINRVPQKEMSSYFKAWDFAIFPSLYEGNPKAILEMLFAGVPVLSTQVDGIAGLLIDEQNSLLTSELDSVGISNLVSRALQMEYPRIIMLTENGYKTVESTHSLEKVASRINKTYRSISNVH